MPVASAHVLDSNNGVSAILHIKPDDNPIAGKSVPINFLFSNDVGGFTLNNYHVQLRLLENSTIKYQSTIEPLFFGSATEGETLATFPDVGVYRVEVRGIPIGKEVSPFTLVYTVRVAASATAKKGSGSTTLVLSAMSIVILGMVAAKNISSGGKYRRAKS